MSPDEVRACTIRCEISGTLALCSRMEGPGYSNLPRAHSENARKRSALLRFFGVAGAEPQPAEHGLALAMLVGVVAGVAGLVMRLALGVQNLELAQHVHDRTQVLRAGRRELHEVRRDPDRH